MGTLTLVRHGQASYGAADYDRLSERGVAQARALGRRWAAERLAPDALVSGPMRRQVDTLAIARDEAIAAGLALPEARVVPELAEYPAFELLARFLPRFVESRPELRPLIDPTGGVAPRPAGEAVGVPTPDRLPSVVDGGRAPQLLDRAFWLVIDAWSKDELDTGDIETFGAFTARVKRGVEHLIDAGGDARGGRRVVAVTSGGPIGVTARLALGLDAMTTINLWRMVRNASTTDLLWRSRGFAWAPGDLSLLGFNHVDHLDAELVTFK